MGALVEKYRLEYSVSHRWTRQLEVGVNASLRAGRPMKALAAEARP